MSIAEKLTAVAENEQKVYEAGKQAQEDAFWEAYQDHGNRTDYQEAFGGSGWTAETFRPRYDMVPVNGMNMFRKSGVSGDLAAYLEELGVKLDFSRCTNLGEVFSNTNHLTRVGVMDVRKSPYATNAFAWSGVKVIDKVILNETTMMANFPGAATELEEIRIEGTIGTNGLNLQYSTKLSRASIESIINALSDTTSGMSITLSETAVYSAFWNEDMGGIGLDWTDLISEKENWTISLV